MVDRKENFKFDLGVKGLTIQMKANKQYFHFADVYFNNWVTCTWWSIIHICLDVVVVFLPDRRGKKAPCRRSQAVDSDCSESNVGSKTFGNTVCTFFCLDWDPGSVLKKLTQGLNILKNFFGTDFSNLSKG